MRIKKLFISLCTMLTIFLISCSGCFSTSSYPFYYDESEIESVSIVYTLEGYYQDYKKYETLVEVEDISGFLAEFKKIQFGIAISLEPRDVFENRHVIMLKYNGNVLEMIDYNAQDIIVNGDSYFGRVYCNEEEFENFINSYLNNN